MDEDLGRELAASGRITEEQLAVAQKMRDETGGELPRILVKLGYLKEHDLVEHIAKNQGLDVVRSEDLSLDEEILTKLPRELVEKNGLLPLSHTSSHLKIALADPGNLPAIEEVRFRTGLEVEVALASGSDIQRVLGRHYEKGGVSRRSRHKMDAREVARQVGVLPATAEAARAVAEVDATPARLVKAVAGLLIEKRLISAAELNEWVHRLE